MNWPDNERPCGWIGERLEAYLDGELTPEETSLIDTHLNDCRDCAQDLEMAQRVARSLHSLPAMTCPDEVVDAVRRKTQPASSTWLQRWLDSWRRPAFVGAMAVALVAVITLVGLQWNSPATVSAEEIAEAEIDTKWAIAKIREVGQKATQTIRNDVLERRVVKPIRRSVLNSIRIQTGQSFGEENNAG